MTSAAIIAICAFGIVAFVAVLVIAYWWHGDVADRKAAELAEEQAVRAQTVAEQTRDQEHVARVAAEAALSDTRTQIAATQAVANEATKEQLDALHKAILAGDTAAFRGVFTSLSTRTAKPDTTAPGGSAAADVQPAGKAG